MKGAAALSTSGDVDGLFLDSFCSRAGVCLVQARVMGYVLSVRAIGKHAHSRPLEWFLLMETEGDAQTCGP